jgi:hypothetical protein
LRIDSQRLRDLMRGLGLASMASLLLASLAFGQTDDAPIDGAASVSGETAAVASDIAVVATPVVAQVTTQAIETPFVGTYEMTPSRSSSSRVEGGSRARAL